MQRSKYDLWVGLFVMLGILSIVFLALKVGNLVNLSFDKTYVVSAQFSNIGGVKAGSPVKSAGVVVGRIKSVTLDNRSNLAIAVIEMQSSYAFSMDSSLRIVTSGLLGEEYVAITSGVDSLTLWDEAVKGIPVMITRTQPSVPLSDVLSQIMPGSDGNQPLVGQIYTVNARFSNIGSIKVGSTVKSSGVIVGKVRSISFDNQLFQAVLTLDLKSDFAFPSDSSMRIMSSGLIGSQFIAISPGIEEQTLEEATIKAQAANNGKPFIVTQTQDALVLEDLIGQFLYSAAADKGSSTSTAPAGTH